CAASALSRRRRWCIRRRGRRRTSLWLEQGGSVVLLVHVDLFRPGYGGDRCDDGVLVRAVLVDDGHVAFATVGDIDQFSLAVPSKRIHTRAIRNGRNDLAVRRVHDDRRFTATGEDPVGRLVIGNARG